MSSKERSAVEVTEEWLARLKQEESSVAAFISHDEGTHAAT